MNQRTLGALARHDIHAFFAAFESGGAAIQAKFAFCFFRAVAPQAGILQDRLNVAGEINFRIGGRRQFGFVNLGGAECDGKSTQHQAPTASEAPNPQAPMGSAWNLK